MSSSVQYSTQHCTAAIAHCTAAIAHFSRGRASLCLCGTSIEWSGDILSPRLDACPLGAEKQEPVQYSTVLVHNRRALRLCHASHPDQAFLHQTPTKHLHRQRRSAMPQPWMRSRSLRHHCGRVRRFTVKKLLTYCACAMTSMQLVTKARCDCLPVKNGQCYTTDAKCPGTHPHCYQDDVGYECCDY